MYILGDRQPEDKKIWKEIRMIKTTIYDKRTRKTK